MLAERGEGNGGSNDAGSYDQEHSGSRQTLLMRDGDMDESVCCIINIIITIIINIITIIITIIIITIITNMQRLAGRR